MQTVRNDAVQTARKSITAFAQQHTEEAGANSVNNEPPLWGVILGTLGRQGSHKQLQVHSSPMSQLLSRMTTYYPGNNVATEHVIDVHSLHPYPSI